MNPHRAGCAEDGGRMYIRGGGGRSARQCLVLDDLDLGPVLVVNVAVPPLVVLVRLDKLRSLVVDHPDVSTLSL